MIRTLRRWLLPQPDRPSPLYVNTRGVLQLGAYVVPPPACVAIERESGGLVRCEDLRPDRDRAYLRGAAS
jgi:DNA-binding transcriptional regulator YdaS (Cro superfamily)